MKNNIKIQSVGDIITNSSTEVFTVIDSSVVNKMKEFIKVLLGEDAVERFKVDLDAEEGFCDLDSEELCEIIEGKLSDIDDSIDFSSIVDEVGGEDDAADMIKFFYYPNNKYLKSCNFDMNKFSNKLKDALKEIDIIDIVESINEGSDYPTYPNLIVEAVDPSNKKDVEIAKKLASIPYFCETEARYC